MMVLKKKEIVAASLVLLIGLAGYLNWSYQDTIRVKDNESYIKTGKMLGEAEPVSAPGKAEKKEEDKTGDKAEKAPETFADARMNRETARAATMEALKAASADESVDEETRRIAGEKLLQCADNIELESSVENIAAAKGYEACVYINDGTASVTVKTDGLSDGDAAAITDIVTGTANIPASGVKIVEVK